MKTVYSKDFDVTITANMITRHNQSIVDVTDLLKEYPQITVVNTGLDVYDVTAPMDEQDHFTFSALIHRLNSDNKLSSKNKPNDKPDPTPPTGGTPGAANQVAFENTTAVAA